tara:strand:- start:2156 stop:2521 length:366 start_codon:yes stop_codon:yes gene_type:complete
MRLLRSAIRKLLAESLDYEFEKDVKPQVMRVLSKLGASKIYVTREKSGPGNPEDWGLQIHFSHNELDWVFEFVDEDIILLQKHDDGTWEFVMQYEVPEEVHTNGTLEGWLYNEIKDFLFAY